MANIPQIPQYQQSIIQSEDKKVNSAWYRFFELLSKPKTTSWTTASRPIVNAGYIGYNTTTSKFEGFDGTNWIDLN